MGELKEQFQNKEISRQLLELRKILEEILPEVEKMEFTFFIVNAIIEKHLQEIKDIFLSRVLSFIQPFFLEGKNKFDPENNRLYFCKYFKKSRENLVRHAVVNIPSEKFPRFFILSPQEKMKYVIFIDDIIRENLPIIFPGIEIQSVYSLKFNRDAELDFEEEYHAEIFKKIEQQFSKREFGQPSSFLFDKAMPINIQLFLTSAFNLKFDEMFSGGRYHNLKDFTAFPEFGINILHKSPSAIHRKL